MNFSEVVSDLHTGRKDNFCDMDSPPDWLGEVEDHVREGLQLYDRFTSTFLIRSLKRIDYYLQNEDPVRMPPLQPKDYSDNRLEEWFENHDRSDYIQKGQYGYYDRLDMALENDVKKAKQVGAQIEHREVFEAAYNFLVDNDIIEPLEPEKEYGHAQLTNEDKWIDLQAVQQNEKDEAIYDALKQLHDTYTNGEFAHERKPVELTDPNTTSGQERTALNLEAAFGLSLLSMGAGKGTFQQNLRLEENDGKLLIKDFAEADRPDLSISSGNKEEYLVGETTGMSTDREIREGELTKIPENAETFADEQGVSENDLAIYFVTALSLNEESMTWRKSFQTHHQYGPSIVPNDIEGHADLFAHFKELDGHSLEQFQAFLKGLSFSAENHDILRDAPNAIEWLNQTVDEAYEQVNDGEIEDIRDIEVTINTRHGEEVDWPLITNGETLQGIIDKLNEFDELMGTNNQSFELDNDLEWGEAVDELYNQIKDFYYGVSELLGYDNARLQSIKEGLKLPFVIGELRELREEWNKQTDKRTMRELIGHVNHFLQKHDVDCDGKNNEQTIHERYANRLHAIPGILLQEGIIEADDIADISQKINELDTLADKEGFVEQSKLQLEQARECTCEESKEEIE